MELRDKKGLTEAEFLAAYDPDRYPKPSLTADIAIFARNHNALKLLLIRRGGHPYLGCLALPGGFSERNESLEQSAARELFEETGVKDIPLTLVGVFSKPGRDPRGWVVTAAYCAVVDQGSIAVQAGDDAADAQWYDVSMDRFAKTLTLRRGEEEIVISDGAQCFPPRSLAFDHAEIISAAAKKVVHP